MRVLWTIALRLLALSLGLAVAFALAEVTFRVVGLGGPAELGPTFDRAPVHYLQDAARGPGWDEDTFKVAVIGDSFTVAETNSWDDGYPKRLERLLNLNAASPPATVWVLAERGTQTIDQLRFLRTALRFDADLVILGIFLNDVEDSEDRELRPLLERTRLRPPPVWSLPVLRASRVLAWGYQQKEEIRVAREVGRYFERIYDPEYGGWKKFDNSLRIFARNCRRSETGLVAVIFPPMGGFGPHYPHRDEHRQIGEALTRRRIPYLDLLDHFVDKADVRMAAYPGIDAHPSEIGHRIAAHAIFRFLLDGGHVDAVYEPEHVYVEKSLRYWLEATRRSKSVVHYP